MVGCTTCTMVTLDYIGMERIISNPNKDALYLVIGFLSSTTNEASCISLNSRQVVFSAF